MILTITADKLVAAALPYPSARCFVRLILLTYVCPWRSSGTRERPRPRAGLLQFGFHPNSNPNRNPSKQRPTPRSRLEIVLRIRVLHPCPYTSININIQREVYEPTAKTKRRKEARRARELIPNIGELPIAVSFPSRSIAFFVSPRLTPPGSRARRRHDESGDDEAGAGADEPHVPRRPRQDAPADDVQPRPRKLRMTEDIAKAKPEDFAAMKAHADQQMAYAISGATKLKQQGNELHGRGMYADAAAKYKLAKDNMKNIPTAAAQMLQLQCALNLMSCYLSRAHELSPDDETIAGVLRDTEEKLVTEGGAKRPKGVVIEEIVEEEEDNSQLPSYPPKVAAEIPKAEDEIVSNYQSMDQPSFGSPPSTADMQDVMRNAMQDPAMQQMLTSMMETMSPDTMANLSRQFGIDLSQEDAAKAQDAISALSMEDLQRMMKWMERAQRGVQVVKKTKDWLIARKGLIIAIVMLILAFILHRLGFIGT